MNEQVALELLESGELTPAAYEKLFGKPAPPITRSHAVANSGDDAAVAQDNSTAVASRGANIEGDVSGLIVTGDNNSLTAVIHQTSNIPLSEQKMREEVGKYLKWVIGNNQSITLQGIQDNSDAQRRYVTLKLEEVYVPLQAQATFGGRDHLRRAGQMGMGAHQPHDEPRDVSLNEVLSLGPRLAITGGPGCGKTTVMMHLAWALAAALGRNTPELARQKLGLGEDAPLPLPIFLPINRYAEHLRQFNPAERRQRTLANFISQYLIERQATLDLPEDFFRQLLASGTHVILLLDGLDEVPTEEERLQVAQAVEDLVRGQENLRVLVTCRTAAYQAIAQFREVRVQPLSDEHIAQLIGNAYKHVYAHSPEHQQEQTRELLSGIRQLEAERRQRLGKEAQKLISTPLLVRMMLIVHISERRLPDQRAELYLLATKNLIAPTYARDVHVRQSIAEMVGGDRALEMLQYVAYHMHERGATQGREIDERELEELLLGHPSFADLAERFMRITRERGTVMEAIGPTFRFIHLGFQELLVARYMDEVLIYRHGLNAILADKIGDSWWREPILLLCGYRVATSNIIKAEELIGYLAGVEEHGEQLPTAQRWPALELGMTAVREWPRAPESLQGVIRDSLFSIGNLLTQTQQSPLRRAWKRWTSSGKPSEKPKNMAQAVVSLGQALSQMGDIRRGVGASDGVPDIAWGGEVSAGYYSYAGEDGYKVNEPYQLAQYTVTYKQFQCFVDADDFDDLNWWHDIPTEKINDQAFKYDNHPRENVSWYQAVAFCRWLSDKLGYEVRLPHEYEWEVAARFNDGRMYPWGHEFDSEKANTRENGLNQTVAVGLYTDGRQPNLNLYDMSGNVWEWCQNKYNDPNNVAVDDSRDQRVLRGGSWDSSQLGARAASRGWDDPYGRDNFVGFRLCRVLRPSSLLSPLTSGAPVEHREIQLFPLEHSFRP